MNQYRVLKWPRKDAPASFFYFKQYRVTDSLLSLPAALKEDVETLAPRTIQLMRFDQEFDSQMLERYFCRKLEQRAKKIYTGSFRPKKSGIRKKREQIYFALVVYASAEGAQLVLESGKLIQKLIDKDRGAKRNVALEVLQEIEDEVDQREEAARRVEGRKDEATKQMEEDGFEVVVASKGGAHRKRAQGRAEGSVGIMDSDFLQKREMEEKASLAREMEQAEAASSFLGMRRGSGESEELLQPDIWMKRKKKKRKTGLKDFYKFQIKEEKKEELEALRRAFRAKKVKVRG